MQIRICRQVKYVFPPSRLASPFTPPTPWEPRPFVRCSVPLLRSLFVHACFPSHCPGTKMGAGIFWKYRGNDYLCPVITCWWHQCKRPSRFPIVKNWAARFRFGASLVQADKENAPTTHCKGDFELKSRCQAHQNFLLLPTFGNNQNERTTLYKAAFR